MIKTDVDSAYNPSAVKPKGHEKSPIWHNAMTYNPVDAVKYMCPSLAQEIDPTSVQIPISANIYIKSAISTTGSRIPDFIARFKSKINVEQDIVFFVEQQHLSDLDLSLRITQTFNRLMDEYPKCKVVPFALLTSNIKFVNPRLYKWNGLRQTTTIPFLNITEISNERLYTLTSPFSVVILAARYMLAARGLPKERERYSLEILDLLQTFDYANTESRHSCYNFGHKIFRIQDPDISEETKRRWTMSPYGSSVEELKLEGKLEGELEGERKGERKGRRKGRRLQFLQDLPDSFELAKFKPEHNQKIYEKGAKLGLPKEMIDAERTKWLKAKSRKPKLR